MSDQMSRFRIGLEEAGLQLATLGRAPRATYQQPAPPFLRDRVRGGEVAEGQ